MAWKMLKGGKDAQYKFDMSGNAFELVLARVRHSVDEWEVMALCCGNQLAEFKFIFAKSAPEARRKALLGWQEWLIRQLQYITEHIE